MVPSLSRIGISSHLAKKVLLIVAFGLVTSLLFTPAVGASAQQQQQQQIQKQQHPRNLVSYAPVPMVVPFDLNPNEGNLTSNVEGNSVPNEPSMIQAATCNKFAISSATANGNDGNVPSNVLDNNLETRWSNNAIGSWIQLDLGTKKSICSVDVAWHRGTERQNNFVISVSNDGTNFANKFSGQSSGTTLALEKYNMPTGTEGRYIRITVNGNTENDWASINEIAAFGGPVSTGAVKGTLYHKWQASPSSSNSWSIWKDIGGGGRSEPIVAQNADGRLQIFTVSLVDNQLYHKWQTKAGDSESWPAEWTNIGSGITIKGDPVVAKNSGGRLEIFAVNSANNQLYHKWQTSPSSSNSWSAWQNLGSGITVRGDPVIASNSDGRLEIFVVNAANNQLYHKWQTSPGSSNSWSLWQNIGSAITIRGDPVVGKNSDGRLEVFAVKPGGSSTANQPPTADAKSVTTSMNTAVDITLSGKDPENGPLTFTVADPPKSGNVAAIAGLTNKVKYTPNTGFTGSDTFTYTAKDNKGAVSSKATVTISVTSGGGGDAGQPDQFGIKKIYASKPGGEKWFMNMQDPSNDPRSDPPSMSRNSDGSWRVTSGQVRYGVFTSSGYHPNDVVKDHSIIASRGYMQYPNDWKNVELTGQVKFNSGDSDENWAWYARGGRHTGSGNPDGCEGSSLKGDLTYTDGTVRWAKEQWHVSYIFSPWQNSPASADGKFVGFKAMMYNVIINGQTAVKLELWVDPNNNNNWQKAYDFIDQGGWGSEGEECNGEPDQIISWGGPIASFRWDGANSVDIKNLSVREIVPANQ